MHRIEKTIIVAASRSAVWTALTNPELIPQWMGEPEMQIEVHTDWIVGGAIEITGFHHVAFRNSGTVLLFEPEQALRYTHISSVSGLADKPENYTSIEFVLASVAAGTSLSLAVDNFPTEVIFKHLDFYWRTTIDLLGKFVEQNDVPRLC